MTIQAIQDFYKFAFSDEVTQEAIMKTISVDDFVEVAVKLGAKNGFEFSKDEMWKTIHKVESKNSFDGIEFPNLWVKKIMILGWVPLGYSR